MMPSFDMHTIYADNFNVKLKRNTMGDVEININKTTIYANGQSTYVAWRTNAGIEIVCFMLSLTKSDWCEKFAFYFAAAVIRFRKRKHVSCKQLLISC